MNPTSSGSHTTHLFTQVNAFQAESPVVEFAVPPFQPESEVGCVVAAPSAEPSLAKLKAALFFSNSKLARILPNLFPDRLPLSLSLQDSDQIVTFGSFRRP